MKNIKEILIRNWFGFVIALMILSLMTNCNSRLINQLEIQKDNITSLQKETATYRLKNGQLVSSVNTLQFDKRQLNDLVLSKDQQMKEIAKRFSQIKTITKEITVTKFDTIQIRYAEPVPCVFQKTDTIKKKWYSFAYESNQAGIVIKDFKTSDSLIHVGGTKRKWLFGKTTATMDITHANPHVETKAVEHYEVPVEKTFVEKYWIKEIVSFVLGVLIAK